VSLDFPGDPFVPRRRPTRVVRVGDVEVGGTNPIRVQSMTTTDTRDVAATVAQIERLVEAGCEIARVTAPSLRDAEALREIRAELDRRGVRIPLVADIHFTPNAALLAAEFVEKVRINPGNYADKKRFEIREYTDAQYRKELERVAGRFRPLVRRCRELGRALRIGTNHGSLSDRVLNRYGDTPRGMVESALEFLDVCEDEGFGDVIFSMKASNPQVAIQAYRMLAARLSERSAGPSYPFHVGVTEAGDGEDGRIKSAIGIGALLADGIGDTVRVSLTEDPVREVPVARALARRAEAAWSRPGATGAVDPGACFVDDPFEHRRRDSQALRIGGVELGGSAPVRVELDLGELPDAPERFAWRLADALRQRAQLACEGLRVRVPDETSLARAGELAAALVRHGIEAPLALRLPAGLAAQAKGVASRWIVPVDPGVQPERLGAAARAAVAADAALEWALQGAPAALLAGLDGALEAGRSAGLVRALVSVEAERPVAAVRLVAAHLRARGAALPLVLVHAEEVCDEAGLLGAAADLGALLCDGLGDTVSLAAGSDPAASLALAYRILQGARQRTTWTEFISCPSCGRTLFDLEETTARIKAKTEHLSGVKIAIMGCIVNGPGEMADADFGYVGSGPGLVNLYVGQECVERHVPAAEADRRLIDLIRRHGAWVDPPG
jgi:(E)-4-hydroxy-3-methylbut-2-enyl-diphosphate synthase